MNMIGGAPMGPADHRHNTRTLDRITGISAARGDLEQAVADGLAWRVRSTERFFALASYVDDPAGSVGAGRTVDGTLSLQLEPALR